MKKLRDAIENTKQLAINEKSYNDFGMPSFESDWNVENCAEIWSIRQALLNGAEWDNITFECINASDGVYWKPCKNCMNTFKDLIDKGDN